MLTSQCLTYEPAQRPSFRTILRDLTRLQPQSEPHPSAETLGQGKGLGFLLTQAQCTQGLCIVAHGVCQILIHLGGECPDFVMFSLGTAKFLWMHCFVLFCFLS